MFKRCIGLLLAVAIVLTAAPAAFADNGRGNAYGKYKAPKLENKFKDWAEANWALKHMTRLQAKGIIKGYEDGSFKPNSAVSQAEAIVMVIRMKGTETEQAAVAMANQNLGLPGSSASWWANGHVAYALQQGWLTRNEIQVNAAAKRSWVARLMVRALEDNWQAQVALHANDTLPFKDANQIKRADVPFIAIAVENQWMVGYPDGKFQPEKPVTRAELITLLDRGEAALPDANPYEAKGTITEINLSTRGVTVSVNGVTESFTVSADALIFLKGNSGVVTLADLHVGDYVKAILNGNNVAIVISVESDQRLTSGRVTAINLTSSPKTITVAPTSASVGTTYNLSSDCKAYWSWTQVALSTVAVGDSVKLTVEQSVVTKIQVTQHGSTPVGTTVIGTLQSISSGSNGTTLVIRDANNVDFTYSLASNATLTWGSNTIIVSQLQVNQTVQATINNSVIVALAVTSGTPNTSTLSGTLRSISAASSTTTLVIRDANGVDFTYSLASSATLTWGSTTISVAQLQVNQTVQATIANGVITALVVTSGSPTTTTLNGTLRAVSTGSSGTTLVIRDANGVDFTYTLASGAMLTSGSTTITVSQLQINQSVQASIQNNLIIALTVTSQPTGTVITGTIQSISTGSSSTTLTVRDANNVYYTHALASNAQLTWGSTTATPSQLQIGQTVRITVNNSVITVLEITNPAQPPVTATITGTLQSISTGSSATTLTVRDANNVNFTYVLAQDAQFKWGTTTVTVSQLATGQTVRITVANQVITMVEITNPAQPPVTTVITGTIQALATGSSGTTLTVRDSNGVDFTHNMAPDAQVKWGTVTVTVNQLATGQTVRITVTNQVITLAEITNPAQPPAPLEITGLIQAITSADGVTTITVRDANNVDHIYPLASNATLTSGTVPITVAQLRTELTVRITVQYGVISTLNVIAQ